MTHLPRRAGVAAAAAIWAVIVAVQLAVFLRSEIVVRDAAGVYLPLAQAATAGDWDHAQSAMFPPLYPIATGLLSRGLGFAQYPQELAGSIISFIAMQTILLCVLVISWKLWSPRVALVALGLTGLNPRLCQMSVNVWLEPTFTAAIMLVLLVLVLTRDRLSLRGAALIGILAGAAALTRSEGFWIPFAGAAGILFIHARKPGVTKARLAAAVGLILLLAAMLWFPRIKYVYDQAGFPLPDVRFSNFIGGADKVPFRFWQMPLAVEDPGPTYESLPRGTWRQSGPGWKDPLRRIGKDLEGLAGGLNPLVLILAIWGLARRRALRRHARVEGAMGVFVAGQLLLSWVALFWDPRYVAVAAPIVGIWAGIGAVEAAEQVRTWHIRRPRPVTGWSCRIAAQLAMLGAVLAIHVPFCLRNAQRTDRELRYAGELIHRQYGPGQVIFARTCPVAYYARGRFVGVPDRRKGTIPNALLSVILQESRARFVFLDQDRKWCPELDALWRAGKLNQAVVPLCLDKGDPQGLLLLEGPKLIAILQ
jgi:4-amino-4-deoxy-L-arabinose transferase-like glycosyltransferase